MEKYFRYIISLFILSAGFVSAGRMDLLAREKPGAAYLKIAPTARSAALRGGGITDAVGTEAVFTNPAGLANSRQMEFFVSHSELFSDSRFDTAAFVLSRTKSAFALSGSVLTRDAMEGRNADRGKSGSFDATDALLGISYGNGVTEALALGMTAKALRQTIAGESANGIALDLGLQWKTPIRSFDVAAKLQNAGPNMRFISRSHALPTTVGGELSYCYGPVRLMLDGLVPLYDGNSQISLAAEIRPLKYIDIRTGYMNSLGANSSNSFANTESMAKFAGWGAGIGLRMSSWQLNYAFVPHESLAAAQTFDFSYRF